MTPKSAITPFPYWAPTTDEAPALTLTSHTLGAGRWSAGCSELSGDLCDGVEGISRRMPSGPVSWSFKHLRGLQPQLLARRAVPKRTSHHREAHTSDVDPPRTEITQARRM